MKMGRMSKFTNTFKGKVSIETIEELLPCMRLGAAA